jgi:predicted AlkP superfamily pyrophosphatase or phosphodiesterase
MTTPQLATPRAMRRLFLITCMAATSAVWAAAAPVATPAPKLVVIVVVDGLPNEQVQRYRDQFGQGGFRRLLDQGAAYSNAHQAHGITLTAVGHTAVLTGAYPEQHGIIANNWNDPVTHANVYCTEDRKHTYIGEKTDPNDGTSPLNLRVSTLGDEMRYASGNNAKVVTVSGKDRGAILLAGKTGTAYMYMDETGNFASSTYYMASHPAWVKAFQDAKPQDKYYGKSWTPLLPEAAYAGDAPEQPARAGMRSNFPFNYTSEAGKPDGKYYAALRVGPHLDQLTLDFAKAAIEGEGLGRNASGATDLLGVSLSSHDYVNHAYGPESKMSHDHLQRLDRMLADFFTYLDKRIGNDKYIVALTADHGFANTPEYSQANKRDAQRIDGKALLAALDAHLAAKFGADKLVAASFLPNINFDKVAIEKKGLRREDVEKEGARFLMDYPGVVQVYTRTQFEQGQTSNSRTGILMKRAWNAQLSGELTIVSKPNWIIGGGNSGTSHGSPYTYDSNVPFLIMGKPWIKPGYYGEYAEVVDLAPTLAHILRTRKPSASVGRVLVETLK